MSKIDTRFEMDEYIDVEEIQEAYSEEMLIACQNGTPCSYGICDECPYILGNNRKDEDNDD